MKIDIDPQYLTHSSLLTMMRKALMTSHSGLKVGESMPRFDAEWPSIRADQTQLAQYREACGYPSDGPLPILYPYVLTSGLQVGTMMNAAFPLKPLGTVHLRNQVLQHRAIGAEEALRAVCFTGESRIAKQGLEYDMHVVITADGKRVWENTSTYLSRGRYGQADESRPKAVLPELADINQEVPFLVPAGMGRSYARITGDYNPIHVSTILAKLFGFSRAIIHGMWSAATCVARLPKLSNELPVRYDVVFKGPVFLGSQVKLQANTSVDTHRFDLFCGKNPKPCLCGFLRNDPAGTTLVP